MLLEAIQRLSSRSCLDCCAVAQAKLDTAVGASNTVADRSCLDCCAIAQANLDTAVGAARTVVDWLAELNNLAVFIVAIVFGRVWRGCFICVKNVIVIADKT